MKSQPVPGRVLLGALMWAVVTLLYYLIIFPVEWLIRVVKTRRLDKLKKS